MLTKHTRIEKEDLICALIEFKGKHGRFPSKEDFASGKITPSMRTYQRRFGSMNKPFEEADKYKSVGEFKDKLEEKKQKEEIEEYKKKYKKEHRIGLGKETKEEEFLPKKLRRRSAAKEPTGFQCPFCGNYTSDANEYYSSLTQIISMRLTGLLQSNNGQDYSDGVMDCIYKVFGTRNMAVRRALAAAGYLEKFEQRYEIEPPEEEY